MKRYIITTKVPGQKLDIKFLASIKTYMKKNKAELIVLSTECLDKDTWDSEAERELSAYQVEKKRIGLNDNLIIYNIKTDPKAADPSSGLDWLSNQIGSIIIPSPKQSLRSVPRQETELPRVLIGTGSVTRVTNSLNKTKRRILSEYHQTVGAVIVEVESRQIYHFRHVQADKNGEFCDLFKKYTPTKVVSVGAEALIPGDWHVGFTDPVVRSGILSILKNNKVKNLVLHDLADMISINPHTEHKLITKAMFKNMNSLELEIVSVANELKVLSQLVDNVVVVKSNHDLFLDRWLDSGGFMKETENREIGLELALEKIRGSDPLKYAVGKYQKLPNVRFLKEDESFLVSKKQFECGFHGHLGPNGARGTPQAINKASGPLIMGHCHAPAIVNNTIVVGTSTYLKVGYNKGPSSWMQTFCIVYPNGNFQLINFVKGRYRI